MVFFKGPIRSLKGQQGFYEELYRSSYNSRKVLLRVISGLRFCYPQGFTIVCVLSLQVIRKGVRRDLTHKGDPQSRIAQQCLIRSQMSWHCHYFRPIEPETAGLKPSNRCEDVFNKTMFLACFWFEGSLLSKDFSGFLCC